MQNKFSAERVQSIMESFGGMQPAAAPDFFYTQLRVKMETPVAEKKAIFILRPAFITTALAVLLIINVISLFQTEMLQKNSLRKEEQQSYVSGKPATIESFAAAYDMHSASVYE